jgi:hypothetical protein
MKKAQQFQRHKSRRAPVEKTGARVLLSGLPPPAGAGARPPGNRARAFAAGLSAGVGPVGETVARERQSSIVEGAGFRVDRVPGRGVAREREATHGRFDCTAIVAQEVKLALSGGENWDALNAMQREACEQIASKLARIVCGDPCHPDHWFDIGGYAHLGAEATF